ncbi:hypothetical protein CLOP_g20013 [Closterium sp. NIES-67]|nr:hypothetical protein CLOP_g20013 [Closterium sp. NIES-67]
MDITSAFGLHWPINPDSNDFDVSMLLSSSSTSSSYFTICSFRSHGGAAYQKDSRRRRVDAIGSCLGSAGCG